MADEKNFENRVKRWLESEGIYALGTSENKMKTAPIGYYEKRWGGGYSKSGLPDLHIVVNGVNIDVELKALTGRASDLQKHCIRQINRCGSIALLLYPDAFDNFKNIVKGVEEKCNTVTVELKHLKNVNTNTKCDTLTT